MRRRAPGGDVIRLGSLLAGADLRGAQYRFVTVDANGNVVIAGVGSRPIGVLQNRPNAGEPCTIIACGESLLEISGGANPGLWLRPDATGRGTGAAGSDICGAILLEPASAAGELVRVYVIPPSPFT